MANSRVLRAADAAGLDAIYATMVAEGRGRTVFVAGDDASGRDDLLRAWADALGDRDRPRPVVVGGVFEGERYVPWPNDAEAASAGREAVDAALAALEDGLTIAKLLLPPAIERLLGYIVSLAEPAAPLIAATVVAADRPENAAVVPTALQALCQDGPAVCIIGSGDEQAGTLWSELAWLLSRHVDRSLPLLLVFGVDGPRDLGERVEGEPEAFGVARELTCESVDVTTWHWLSPLTARDLEVWAGRAADDVVSWLLEITDGRSGEMRRRWHDWQQRGLIEQRSGPGWCFAAGHDPTLDMDGLLDGRTRRLCEASAPGVRAIGTVQAIAAAQRLLGCAALEGRRFTAAAVALALERDPEELMSFIDTTLVLNNERPDGLLIPESPALVASDAASTSLKRYRFARELDWIVLRHHGLSRGEQSHDAGSLARALEELLGDHADARADTLARLFNIAGNHERARYYEHIVGVDADGRITLWRARNALNAPHAADAIGRQRMATRLIEGALRLQNVGPFDEGFSFARAAQILAQGPEQLATAVLLTGEHLLWSGDFGRGRTELVRALELYRALGPTELASTARAAYLVAHCDRAQGDLKGARAHHRASLEIYRELGHRSGEANALSGLASCDLEQGNLERARAGSRTALEIYREIGYRAGEADVLNGLASCDFEQGDLKRARAGYRTALEIRREIGDRYGEARALSGLANCDREQGDLKGARAGYRTALEIYREVGERSGEAQALTGLATCDREQGDLKGARAGYRTGLEIFREIEERSGEAQALTGLATCDREQGDLKGARAGYRTGLEIYREIGNRPREARTLRRLADCDREQGDLKGAHMPQ